MISYDINLESVTQAILAVLERERAALVRPEYMDLKQLEKYSGFAESTLRKYIRNKGLPQYKIDGKIVVRVNEFDVWISQYRSVRCIADKANEIIGDFTRSVRNTVLKTS